jgi:hypothetical protein
LPGVGVVDTVGRTGSTASGSGEEGRRADTSVSLHGLTEVIAKSALVGDGVNELASGAHTGDSIEDLPTWTGLGDTLVALVKETVIADTLTERIGGRVRPAVVLGHTS